MSSSNNARPPGGTSRVNAPRTPGTRTPRKVQWPDDPSDQDSTQEVGTPSHMLDEHGKDPERFQALTEALEQHRRATPLKKVHYYPPVQSESASTSQVADEQNHDTEPGFQAVDDRQSIYPISPAASSTAFTPVPCHQVPDNYISEDEDAGLPGTKDLRKFSYSRAEDVVQNHMKHRSAGLSSRLKRKKKAHERQLSMDSEKDVENEGDQQRSGNSAGILSTLLNLYQQPDPDYLDGALSYASSRRSSFERLEETIGEQERSKLISKSEKQKAAKKADHEEKKQRVYHSKAWSFDMPSILGHVSRPAAARNAGGVFGPLIASTGNIAGVAAPHASTLQPNIKRPGYKLSRYSLETKPITKPRPVFPRSTSAYSVETHRHFPSFDNAEGPGSPLEPPIRGSFYEQGSKGNFSSAFGGYVSSIRSGRRSGYSTPTGDGTRPGSQTPTGSENQRQKRRKAEVFITRHVAQIIQREEFLMKLTRAMMMFGGPSHRLQSMIQSAARVLDIKISFMYLPDIVLLSFDDAGTGTSHIKFIRQASALDLGKLDDAFALYWRVIHDRLSVSNASVELDVLMRKKPRYNWPMTIFIGGMCSSAICTVSFGGSFVDALVSFPLGALLVAIQLLSVRNVLYSNVFEVTITTLFSFIAASLAETHKICYSAVTSSSVVLILPGFLVLTGALELMSRHIVAGSVRLGFAVVYALFLGFGFTIGAELFELFTTRKVYGAEDYTCSMTHNPDGPWYQRTPSVWWAFLTVPMYSTFLSMRNQAPWNRKEMPLLVGISSVGWVTNYFAGRRFVGQSDIIAAVGAFAVGLISNLYSRIFSGNAFVVMITGIMFQLPSGLGSGGLLSYASKQAEGNTEAYVSGFQTALKLVSVAIGLTIGLGLSLVLTHPIQSRKREAGIFSL